MYDRHFTIYNLIAELRGTSDEIEQHLPKGMTKEDLTISDEEILDMTLGRSDSGIWYDHEVGEDEDEDDD